MLKEEEKIEKHKFAYEIKSLWKMKKVSIHPAVIGALGSVTDRLEVAKSYSSGDKTLQEAEDCSDGSWISTGWAACCSQPRTHQWLVNTGENKAYNNNKERI